MALVLRGTMRAHTDTVTAIATPITTQNPDMIVSASRDHSLIVWSLTKDGPVYGVPRLRLTGHSDSVEDVVLSSKAEYVISASSDAELRLWSLVDDGLTVARFVGHSREVLSVAIVYDRAIMSASRDNTIKLWNTRGECTGTIQGNDAHTDSVTCVRFLPNASDYKPTLVSSSLDKTVKIWNVSPRKLISTLTGHGDYVNTVAISPDGSLCASGGKEGKILLWNLAEGKHEQIDSLEAGDIIHAICYCPIRYWLCAATESAIRVWDLESETKTFVQELKVDVEDESEPGYVLVDFDEKAVYCTSMSWSADGETLFCGFTDGVIRVYGIQT